MTLPLVSTALHLPHSILNPTLNSRAELTTKAREIDEKLEQSNIDEHSGEGKGENKDQTEEADDTSGSS